MAVEHDFSWRVAVTSIYKGFKSSPDAGLQAIKNTVKDLDSQGKSDFSTVIQIRVNPKTGERDLFWGGYERSISESMRRYVAFLKVNGASEERIRQAKVDWQIWKGIKDAAVDLQSGQSISFLALRDVDPRAGLALQMVSNKNGSLVLSSSLLPFNDLGQINLFTSLLGRDRQQLNLGIDVGDSLSPLLTWVVKGPAIDFEKELPELIEQAFTSEESIRPPSEVVWEPVREFAGGVGAGLGVLTPFISEEFPAEPEPPSEVDFVPSGFWFVSDASHLRGVTDQSNRMDQLEQAAVSIGSQESVSTRLTSEESPRLVRLSSPQVRSGRPSEVDEAPVSVPLFVPLVISEVFSETVVEEVVFEADKSVVQVEIEQASEVSDVSGRADYAEPTLSGEIVIVEDSEVKDKVRQDVSLAENVDTISVSQPMVIEEVVDEEVRVTEVENEIGQVMADGLGEIEADSLEEQTEVETYQTAELVDVFEEQREETRMSFFGQSLISDEAVEIDLEMGKLELVGPIEWAKKQVRVLWGQRSLMNVVADGLIGKILGSKKKVREEKTDKEMIPFSLLINSLAMMQFDGVEERPYGGAEEGRLVQFRLSPMRIWADRVKNLVRATKKRFRQTSLYVYKQIFLNS